MIPQLLKPGTAFVIVAVLIQEVLMSSGNWNIPILRPRLLNIQLRHVCVKMLSMAWNLFCPKVEAFSRVTREKQWINIIKYLRPYYNNQHIFLKRLVTLLGVDVAASTKTQKKEWMMRYLAKNNYYAKRYGIFLVAISLRLWNSFLIKKFHFVPLC